MIYLTKKGQERITNWRKEKNLKIQDFYEIEEEMSFHFKDVKENTYVLYDIGRKNKLVLKNEEDFLEKREFLKNEEIEKNGGSVVYSLDKIKKVFESLKTNMDFEQWLKIQKLFIEM